jgi:hypothetical protein
VPLPVAYYPPLPLYHIGNFIYGTFRQRASCRDVPSELPPRRRLEFRQVHEGEETTFVLHF